MKQTILGSNNNQTSIGTVIAQLSNTSSIIANALPKIAELVNSSEADQNDTTAFDIEDKITYNNVISFKDVFNEYASFGPKIDEIYDTYENDSPGFKSSISRYFKTKYQLTRNTYANAASGKQVIDVVKENADKILTDVIEGFKKDLQAANNLTLKMEDLDVCAVTVVCHAFTACKILEKPVDN